MGEEGGGLSPLGRSVDAIFFKAKLRSHLQERRQPFVTGDTGNHIVETFVETTQQGDDEILIRHRRAEIAELICELLHLGAVGHHGHVALVDVVEVGADVD